MAMTSPGSGSYPLINVYRQEKGNFVRAPLGDLTEAQRTGYMGHDLIEVKDGKLLRTFPKYLPNDPNSSPSGGTVALRYSFTDDAWFDRCRRWRPLQVSGSAVLRPRASATG